MHKANNCLYELETLQDDDIIDISFKENLRLSTFVEDYHRWLISTETAGNPRNFTFYPHHIFSFPWNYKSMPSFEAKDVVAYRYSIQSLCLGYDNGKFTRKELKERHHDIKVK